MDSPNLIKGEIMSETKFDLDETPQSRQRKKYAKIKKEQEVASKPVDVWYVEENKKILRKSKAANGNVKTDFIGMVNKKNMKMIAELKKSSDFRG